LVIELFFGIFHGRKLKKLLVVKRKTKKERKTCHENGKNTLFKSYGFDLEILRANFSLLFRETI